ncbi:hypothetical protein [Mesorhizobium amorphae]|uniref:hypothetical protein n=1 Tax=Mesorhizobium amorphae TaxID=71433 RepID=UPI001182344B|nr:hypothetical protein [Mesorhizobium amorphae]
MTVSDMTRSEQIVNSVIITAIARLAMVAALPVIYLVFQLYSSQQASALDKMKTDLTSQIMAAQAVASSAQTSASDASTATSALSTRLTAVETKQSEAATSNERFQTATLSRLDRMSDSLVGLSNAVAALTASVQLVVDEKRSRPP